MVRVKITLPVQSATVGKVDLEMFKKRGKLVTKIRSTSRRDWWGGWALDVPSGCLIFVPDVKSEEIA